MKVLQLGLLGISTVAASLACQPVRVIATVDKGLQPEARTYQTGDLIFVEVKVPLVSGVDAWQAKFAGEEPKELISKRTNRETVFTWIVPKDRITWFGTNGYTLKLTGAEHSRELNIRVTKQATNVANWVIHVFLLGA
jgi:hypothetical protein